MQHALITPQSESEQLATLAAGAMDAASRQQTRTAGSATYHNPDGTKTLIGADAAGSGIAPWVGDTTPPGTPTGVSAESGAGLVLVSWDGSLDGGVPADFDHVQILVDGTDAGRLTAKGTLACGPYEPGTGHTVTAVAWDDAHAQDGSPAPNASPACAPIRVTVTGADIDPSRLGITVTKSDKDPQGLGEHTGDLWLRYDQDTEGRNVLRNPGFETGDRSGWSADWRAQVIGGSVHGGRYCVSDIPKSQAWSELCSDDMITVYDGDTVIMRAWVGDVKLPHDGFYLTYRPEETSEAYTGEDAYCVFEDDTGKWVQYERRYTHHGATQHWRLLITTWQEDNPSGWFNIDDVEYRVLTRGALSGEWWWDGSQWVQIPVAIYLDQLVARDVQVDEAVVGMLAAGIIRSGTFVTDDGLVGFDASGFWVRDTSGSLVFQAGAGGVSMTGSLETASGGDRLRVSRRYLPSLGRTVGALEGLHDDASRWALTGFYDAAKTEVQLSANGHLPNIAVSSPAAPDSDMLVLTGQDVEIGAGRQKTGSSVSVDARTVLVQGVDAGCADYDTASVMTFAGNVVNYKQAMRLYRRAGVFYLDFNVQGKGSALFPQGQLVPCVALSRDVMPSSAIDVWAYGGYGTLVRVHVFGPGEGQPQGTISVTAKDRSTDYVSGQLHWVQ